MCSSPSTRATPASRCVVPAIKRRLAGGLRRTLLALRNYRVSRTILAAHSDARSLSKYRRLLSAASAYSTFRCSNSAKEGSSPRVATSWTAIRKQTAYLAISLPRCRHEGAAPVAGECLRNGSCVTSYAGPHGAAQLYERWRMALRVRQSGVDLKPPQAAVVKSDGGERCGNVGT
jgi:hypothetical protein